MAVEGNGDVLVVKVKVLQLKTGCPIRRLFEVKLQNYSSAKFLICKIPYLQNYISAKL